jgi:hypothetical protein
MQPIDGGEGLEGTVDHLGRGRGAGGFAEKWKWAEVMVRMWPM